MKKAVIMRTVIFSVVLSFVCLPAAFAQFKEVEGLKTSIEAERAEYGAEEPLGMRFSLTNTSGRALNVLKWQTPLEGFNADIFDVKRDGKQVLYVGRTVKRGAPRPEDYVTIAPGESVSAVVDLSSAYAIYDTGDYSVEFRSRIYDYGEMKPADLAAKGVFAPKDIGSNRVTFKLSVARKRPAEPLDAPPVPGEAAKVPVFKGCSQSQKDTLNQALTNSQNIAAGSYLCLSGLAVDKRAASPRYKEWFGAYTATRWSSVTDHFQKVHDALVNKTITFNCDCNESHYAHVYPNKPYEIFLCNAFWAAPMNGTDSKAGTIVHETSHFYVVASTKDHAYGQSSCRTLATNDPGKATMNADSHEYFAENTPSLKCGLDLGMASLFIVVVAAFVLSVRRGRSSGA